MKLLKTTTGAKLLAAIGLLTASANALAASGCNWLLDTRNQVLPETHALYYRATPPNTLPVGSYIRIRGQFVNARYESFQLYNGLTLANDGSLVDYNIGADSGSVNPAVSRSERDPAIATGGSYTVNIKFPASLPASPEANTLYTTNKPSNEVITLRRYVSSTDLPLPIIEVVAADGTATPLPTPANSLDCASQQTMITLGTYSIPANTPFTAPAGKAAADQNFAVYYGNGIAQNQDARYLSVVVPRNSYYLLARGRAPTSVGYHNSAVPNFRYWSFCSYNYIAETVVGCAADYEAKVDSSGFYYVALNAGVVPMATGADALYSVLPMGSENKNWFIMRQILDDLAFGASANDVPQGTDPLTVMGDYLPVARTCSPTVFNAAVLAGGTSQSVWDACAASQ